MDNRDWIFTITFIVSLALSLYFLGSSITGFVVQSMHCPGSICKELCRFNTDCTGTNEICCDIGGFGVCEKVSECEEEYLLQLEADVENLPKVESPTPVQKSNVMIHTIVTLLILLVGLLDFLGRKHSKKAVSKKRR